MPRTTEQDVRDVYSAHAEGTALDTPGVQFHINTANQFVTDRLASDISDADTLRRLETLVACHFIHASDPSEAEFAEGDASATFEGANQSGTGLAETRFGRLAITVDPTGVLADEGKPSATFATYGADTDDPGE
jgi:hypothetical protein